MFQKVKIKPRKGDITPALLEEFVTIDKEIVRREQANDQHLLTLKEKILKQYDESLNKLLKFYENCVSEVTRRNSANETIHSVHSFLQNHFTYDDEINAKQLTLTESEEEFLDQLNRLEMTKKDLDNFSKQKNDIEDEIELIKKRLVELKKKYSSQDQLLAFCFGGTYGNKREQQLEADLDKCIERKQRIQLSHFKWKSAKIFAQFAATQMQSAINRWQEIGIVAASQMEKRYTLTTDVRNYLVCAIENLINAQKYLHSVTFPYCTPEEVDTLYTATVHVYSDMQTVFRHAYALQCFSTTHRRIEALIQWFDSIINKDMTRDLKIVCEEVNDLTIDLREERLLIMKRKIKEATGDDVNLEDLDYESAEKKMYMADIMESQISHAPQLDNDKGYTARKVVVSLMNAGEDAETGVHYVKKQHERDVQLLNKAQRVTKTRMEEGLNKKLQQRRESRLHQLQELSQSVDKSFRHLRQIQPARPSDTLDETTA